MDTSSKARQGEAREAIKFLESDFIQCFQQMRHYDEQIMNLCKFAFLSYSSITGAAIGLYKFGIEKDVDLLFPASIIVGIGLIVGLLLFCMAMRNRVYFVRVSRYINEVREIFVKHNPMGFENKSRMYTDWRKPMFYNLYSSQLWVCYMLAFLNAILVGALLYMQVGWCSRWKVLIITSCLVGLLFLQIAAGNSYLKSYENKFAVERNTGQQNEG